MDSRLWGQSLGLCLPWRIRVVGEGPGRNEGSRKREREGERWGPGVQGPDREGASARALRGRFILRNWLGWRGWEA